MDAETGKTVVKVLASVLDKLVRSNDGSSKAQKITKFHALRPPSISIKDYLDRILKYSACSSECFVLALVYIDRLIQQTGFVVSSLNIHRVVITSVMLAAKFFDDHYYNNAYYAKIGGVPCTEMNSLELEMLFQINFSLHVDTDAYNKYYSELCNHAMTVAPAESWKLGMYHRTHYHEGMESSCDSSVIDEDEDFGGRGGEDDEEDGEERDENIMDASRGGVGM